MTLRLDFTIYTMVLMLYWPLQPGDNNIPNSEFIHIRNIIDRPTCMKIANMLIDSHKKNGGTGFRNDCIQIRSSL